MLDKAVVGFCNLLVHAYTRIDAARVHQALHTHLDDFQTFARHNQRYLDRQPG